MVVATFGAFGLAIYRGVNHLDIEGFDEACAVLLFYQVGEFSKVMLLENRENLLLL